MNEQKTACEAIVEAMKEDAQKKGSKRKKIDHWKSFACAAIGIKKMGQARWNMTLNYGYQHNYFQKSELNGKEILVLKEDEDTPNQISLLESDDEQEIEDSTPERDHKGYLPSDYVKGTSMLKTTATRPKEIAQDAHRSKLYPQKGDILWTIRPDNSVFQSEVEEVSFGAHVTPLSKKDGHWCYATSNDLFEDQKEAQKEADRRKRNKESGESKSHWAKQAMSQAEYALFQEYLDNREAFKAYIEKFDTDDSDLEDLI